MRLLKTVGATVVTKLRAIDLMPAHLRWLEPVWHSHAGDGVRRNWILRLLRFQREVHLDVAIFDFDCLLHASRGRFTVHGHAGVFAGGDVLDRKPAILAGDREIGMIRHVDVSEHPRMHIALEPQEILRLGESENLIRAARHLRLVVFLVAGCRRRGMDVVQHRVGILHHDLLAGLAASTYGVYSQPFWSMTIGSAGAPVDLPLMPFNVTNTSASSPLPPTTKKRVPHRFGLQLAAIRVVLDPGDFLFGRRRALEGDGAGDVAGGGNLRGADSGDGSDNGTGFHIFGFPGRKLSLKLSVTPRFHKVWVISNPPSPAPFPARSALPLCHGCVSRRDNGHARASPFQKGTRCG